MFVTTWYKILFVCILLFGCSGTIGDQQFEVRNIIDTCSTFDCSVLEREKQTLQKYIEKGMSPIIQGIQQSIVTSITRRCNKNYTTEECSEYEKKMEILKDLLNKYDK